MYTKKNQNYKINIIRVKWFVSKYFLVSLLTFNFIVSFKLENLETVIEDLK